MTLATVLLVALVLLLLLVQKLRRPSNFPPGPPWLPLVGCLPRIKALTRATGYQHAAFSCLAAEYGTPVIGLRLGSNLAIVVTSYASVREVFMRSEFDGRPDTFFIRLRSMGTRKGITCVDGPLWHEQRAFAVRHLRQLGLGRPVMEELVQAELEEMFGLLSASQGPHQLAPHLARAVLNVLWALTAGTRFSSGDPRLPKLLHLMTARSQAFDMAGGTLSMFPWLRFFAPERSGYNLLQELNKSLYQIFMDTIQQHRSSFCPGSRRDLIDAYLCEMVAREGKESTFTEEQLLMVCLDLFIAGSQTTSHTLGFAFLMVLLHPELQAKVHKELDDVVGPTCHPCMEDRIRMPFTEALLLEVLRLFPSAPIAGPRRTLTDTSLQGYHIPKDTIVLINLYAVHTDPNYWSQPEKFMPERFLDANGRFVSDERILTFGLGRRRCLGEMLARGCIFLLFTGLLHKFRLVPPPGTDLPSDKPQPGLNLAPPPFEACLELRDL